MDFRIIPRQEDIPPFDPAAIRLKHIACYEPPYQEYDGAEITEAAVQALLEAVPGGVNVYLSLVPGGEDDWLEVNSDGKQISLSFSSQSRRMFRASYNPAYAGTAGDILRADFDDPAVYSPLESGGQSPIPNLQTVPDMAAGVRAVEYFIRTGDLYPGIDWLEE